MKYILVQWPESQYLMEHERFEECILADETGGYFCPEDLYCEVFNTMSDKDKFIEKASAWIGTHLISVSTRDVIKDFKKAMQND